MLGDTAGGFELAKSRSRKGSTQSPSREAADFANPLDGLLTGSNPTRSGRLMAVEDRRLYSPERFTLPRTARHVARVVMAQPSTKAKDLGREVQQFRIPKQVAVCARREIRKQVIHAKGIAGTKVRRPKRNAWSNVSCRRK